MRKNYIKQILDYNIEKFNLIVKDDINMFSFSKSLIKTNKNAPLKINFVSNIKKIKKNLKQHIKKNKYIKL